MAMCSIEVDTEASHVHRISELETQLQAAQAVVQQREDELQDMVGSSASLGGRCMVAETCLAYIHASVCTAVAARNRCLLGPAHPSCIHALALFSFVLSHARCRT